MSQQAIFNIINALASPQRGMPGMTPPSGDVTGQIPGGIPTGINGPMLDWPTGAPKVDPVIHAAMPIARALIPNYDTPAGGPDLTDIRPEGDTAAPNLGGYTPPRDFGAEERALLAKQAEAENAGLSIKNPHAPSGYARSGPELIALALAAIGNAFDKKHQMGTAGLQAFRSGVAGAQNQQYQEGVQQATTDRNLQMAKAGQIARELALTQGEDRSAQSQAHFDQTMAYNREIKKQQDDRQTLDHAQTAYNQAKTLGAMKQTAARMRPLDPNAPSDKQVEADFEARTAATRRMANTAWEQSLSHELNAFGEVAPERAGPLESERQAIAKEFGLEDASPLRNVPTGETLRKQAADQHKIEFADHLQFLKDKQREDLAIKRANVDQSAHRLQVYEQSVNNAIAMGQGNLAVRQYEAHLAAHNADIRALNSEIRGGLTGLDPKIIAAQATYDSVKAEKSGATEAQVASAAAKLAALKDQKTYLVNLHEPEIQTPFGMMANPTYQPSAGATPQPNFPQPTLEPMHIAGPIPNGPAPGVQATHHHTVTDTAGERARALAAIQHGKDPAAVRRTYQQRTGQQPDF